MVSPKVGVWQKCSRTQGSKEILREMSEGRLRSLEKLFFFREEIVNWRRKIKWRKKMNSVNSGRKVMKEEAKKKKRKTRQMGGQNSTPTLKTQQVAKSTQSNWVDSINSQKKKKSFSFFIFLLILLLKNQKSNHEKRRVIPISKTKKKRERENSWSGLRIKDSSSNSKNFQIPNF